LITLKLLHHRDSSRTPISQKPQEYRYINSLFIHLLI